MNITTIVSKDGKLSVHGNIISWDRDEFNFVPYGGSIQNPWWCKLDFWDVIEGIKIYNLKIRS